MAKILIIGGAGYVGSSTLSVFLSSQVGLLPHEVWVLDDFSTGHPELVLSSRFVRGQLGDRALVRALLEQEAFDGVFHFAAKSIVPESIQKPELYFENNVHQTKIFLEEYIEVSKKNKKPARFVFSSTCAIFSPPQGLEALNENSPLGPLTPYGETKLEVEELLDHLVQDSKTQGCLSAVSLRYFNASGAVPPYATGEWHHPETHLIPNLLQKTLKGEPLDLYGVDHPTPDGTCVRDYIHVKDLALAHWSAYQLLQNHVGRHFRFNLGSEKGYSVLEVIETSKTIFKKHQLPEPVYVQKPKRQGDPPRLVADAQLAKTELGFKAQTSLVNILEDALLWELKLRKQIKTYPAVFFDRDETLNPDFGYMKNPDQLELFPWVAPSLKALKSAGYKLFVVSNQSGVGRGLFDHHDLEKMNLKLNTLLFEQVGFQLDGWMNCVHAPDERCECRKPSPKMLLELAKIYSLNLSRSFMLGDRESDLQAGNQAGLRKSYLLKPRDQASFEQAIESILKHD